jgi:4-hydroxybenzoate polyprenyltransferase
MLCLLFSLFWLPSAGLGWIYFAGVLLVAGLLLYEHSLVRPDDLTRVNQAFFHVNSVISLGLFLIILVQIAVG